MTGILAAARIVAMALGGYGSGGGEAPGRVGRARAHAGEGGQRIRLGGPRMTPQQFSSKWADNELKESAASKEHFIDVCALVGAVNLVLEQIGRWHDTEVRDPERRVSPLRPHDLRHTFDFRLAAETGADAYELERRLGHRSQRYIQRYTNPPEDVSAGYVEKF